MTDEDIIIFAFLLLFSFLALFFLSVGACVMIQQTIEKKRGERNKEK